MIYEVLFYYILFTVGLASIMLWGLVDIWIKGPSQSNWEDMKILGVGLLLTPFWPVWILVLLLVVIGIVLFGICHNTHRWIKFFLNKGA